MSKPTLVLGASLNPGRYSNLAVRRLAEHGHRVVAVGRRDGSIGAVPVVTGLPADLEVDTITLYLNPDNQQAWHARIVALRPQRVIFNPGSEDAKFAAMLASNDIEVVEGCTLVMLAVGTF
ncbi:MAG: CoA-binding protein [Flavobacteriales bacterium]